MFALLILSKEKTILKVLLKKKTQLLRENLFSMPLMLFIENVVFYG